MKLICILFLLILSLCLHHCVESALVFNETFHDLTNWAVHLSGHANHVGLAQHTSNDFYSPPDRKTPGNYSLLFTNVTECGVGHCYRAEVAMRRALRSLVIPNTSSIYWVGFSFYIPKSFHWQPPLKELKKQDVTIHFQLHGGDNAGNSPIVGLRQTGERLYVQLCGNTYRLEFEKCTIYDIGKLVQGQWIDVVMQSQLAAGLDSTTGKPKGWFKLWRNNRLMVNVTEVLTAFEETNPPYFILGSYQINWKFHQVVGYNWAAAYHNGLRIGLADSYYEEVYTGDGSFCGKECDREVEPYVLNAKVWWVIVPFTIVILGSLILFLASDSYRQRQVQKWKRQQALEATAALAVETEKDLEEGTVNLETAEEIEGEELNMSYERFLSEADKVTIEEKSESQKKSTSFYQKRIQQWKRFKAEFKNSSTTRTIFWYAWAVLWCGFTIYVAAIFYGLPEAQALPTPLFNGLIPWQGLRRWTILQVTMTVISATMTCVYFFPLFYLPHDFEAGKRWKNDPNFLRRIGVIIPCHKSANEIGEVIRRVLNYIPPENIVVCDNGDYDWPPDNTFEVVKALHPHIRYLYIKQGHKTRALWTGAHRLPTRVEYIIHLDDDTHFDEHHMVFDESHFLDEDHVISVAFLRSSYPTNSVTEYTDFWYKMTDHFHATQAKITTRCFVPGPAGIWRRDKFMEIFGKHPTLPFGEDIFGGFTTLNNGYAIRAETRCMVKTFAPDTLFPNWTNSGRIQGYGASSLWKQRANRWTVSALRITGKSLYSFFTYDSKLGLFSNIAFRLYRFREYKLILAQVFYIPFLLVIFAKGYFLEFFILKFALFALPLLRNLFINYICWRGQPELQVPLKTILLSPFFNFYLIVCAIHGRWKCILWYLPQIAPKHGFLVRCRPQPLTQVPLEDRHSLSLDMLKSTEAEALSNGSYDSQSMSETDSNSGLTGNHHHHLSGSNESFDVRDGPSFALEAFREDAEEDFSMNMIPPEAVLTADPREDSNNNSTDSLFELFDREGGLSVFVRYRSAQTRLIEFGQRQAVQEEILKSRVFENSTIPLRTPSLPSSSLLVKSLEHLEAGTTYWSNNYEKDKQGLYPVQLYSPTKSFRTVRTAATSSSASEDDNDPVYDPRSSSPATSSNTSKYDNSDENYYLKPAAFPVNFQSITLEMQNYYYYHHSRTEEIAL